MSGERIVVDDVEKSPIFVGNAALDIQLRAGIRAVQSTPLRGHAGDILGMFSTHYRTPHRPDERTLQIVDLLAVHAVSLIERAHANEALEKALEQLAYAQKIAHLGSFEYDVASGLVAWSDEQYRIHGFPPSALSLSMEEIVSQCVPPEERDEMRRELEEAFARRQAFEREHRIVRPDGSVRWIHTQAHPRMDAEGRIAGYVGTSLDISERKAIEDKIRDLAFYDVLTGLPNRRLLADRLGQALAGSHRSQEFCALMMLDLDHFKRLNDTRGHDVGDRLLVQVAKRLVDAMRQEDTVARLGGDEFVVVINGLGADPSSAATQSELVAEKLRESLSKPYALENAQPDYACTPSIGLTLFRGADLPVELLMKQADIALYQAKDAGRNAIRRFDPARA